MRDFGAVFKEARPRALACLQRFCSDLDHAEDALQDAIEQALKHWPVNGLPDQPAAWLVRTGQRKLIDGARRSRFSVPLSQEPGAGETEPETSGLDDDLLRLIFTCCHPALNESSQVALTLKLIAGLSTDDVAAAFLVPRRTMEQRLQRARSRIRDAGIPYRVPSGKEHAERLNAVMAVIYLVFNQGYSPRADHLTDAPICDEAIWLARLLLGLFPGHCELSGLLCLMLFHSSRLPARQNPSGQLIPLDRQDRSLWQRSRIEEARIRLQHVLSKRQPGPYQTQAAIAALHCEAESPEHTDWAQIAILYRALEQQSPNPVVTINRAVALGEAGQPAHGLRLLDSLDRDRLSGYPPWLLARSRLLALSGHPDQAADSMRQALARSANDAERRFLEFELDRLRQRLSC